MMSKEVSAEMPSADRSTGDEIKESLKSSELAELADPEKQAKYRREYLAQLKRQACPGCGENDEVF